MSTSNSLNNASEQFYREVRKLEVRLNDYLKEEEAFVTEIRNCIAQFKSLYSLTSKLDKKNEPKEIADALALKTKSEETFSKAVMQQGEAGHEGSHLLESYGALILALQKLEDELIPEG
jgi:hypothetical protein